MKFILSNSLSKKKFSRFDKNKKKTQNIFFNYNIYYSNKNFLTSGNQTFEKDILKKNYSTSNNKNKLNYWEKNSVNIPDYVFDIIKKENNNFHISNEKVSEEKIDSIINNLQFRIFELENGKFIINTKEKLNLKDENELNSNYKNNTKKSENKKIKILDYSFVKSKKLSVNKMTLQLNRNFNKKDIINKKLDFSPIKFSTKLDIVTKILYSKNHNIKFENNLLNKVDKNENDNLSSSRTNANTSSLLTNRTKIIKNGKKNDKIKKTTKNKFHSPKYINIKCFEEISPRIKKNNSTYINKFILKKKNKNK